MYIAVPSGACYESAFPFKRLYRDILDLEFRVWIMKYIGPTISGDDHIEIWSLWQGLHLRLGWRDGGLGLSCRVCWAPKNLGVT